MLRHKYCSINTAPYGIRTFGTSKKEISAKKKKEKLSSRRLHQQSYILKFRIGMMNGSKRHLQGVAILIVAGFALVGIDAAAAAAATAEPPSLGNEIATLSGDGLFHTGPSYRQDVCDRYLNKIANGDEFAIREALSGMELTVSVSESPFFRYDETTGIDPDYPGVNARLLDYIAEHGNLTWRNSFGVWKHEEVNNRTYTDVLLWGAEKYDVNADTWTPSTTRMNLGISFANGHFDGSLIMARYVEPMENKIIWFSFLHPFELSVWFVIFGIVIFSSIIYQFIEHLGANANDPHDKSFRTWVMENLYLSFINITGNYSYEPTTLGGRVFGFSFAFWAMLITGT
jgi:hypothetical protein